MPEEQNKTYLDEYGQIVQKLNHAVAVMPNVRLSFAVSGRLTIDDVQPYLQSIDQVRYYVSRSYIGYSVLKDEVKDEDPIKKLYNAILNINEDKDLTKLNKEAQTIITQLPEQSKLDQYTILINKFLVNELNKYKGTEKVLSDVM